MYCLELYDYDGNVTKRINSLDRFYVEDKQIFHDGVWYDAHWIRRESALVLLACADVSTRTEPPHPLRRKLFR